MDRYQIEKKIRWLENRVARLKMRIPMRECNCVDECECTKKSIMGTKLDEFYLVYISGSTPIRCNSEDAAIRTANSHARSHYGQKVYILKTKTVLLIPTDRISVTDLKW